MNFFYAYFDYSRNPIPRQQEHIGCIGGSIPPPAQYCRDGTMENYSKTSFLKIWQSGKTDRQERLEVAMRCKVLFASGHFLGFDSRPATT